MPLLSVVIPTYNCAEYIPEAMSSVLIQSLGKLEVIVVDDGSTDNTRHVVGGYVQKDGIRYILQENAGPAAARNRGVRESRGEFIAVLDADDMLAPGAIHQMIGALERSDASWCITDIEKFDEEFSEVQKTRLPSGDLWRGILKEDFIRRAMFFRKSALDRVGGWDERIFGREDWDINIRFIEKREPFVYLQKPLYRYRRRVGSITTGGKERFFVNTERLLKKHHKALADAGDREVGKIYAQHMMELARRYFRELGDVSCSLRCIRESVKYDFRLARLVSPMRRALAGAR